MPFSYAPVIVCPDFFFFFGGGGGGGADKG